MTPTRITQLQAIQQEGQLIANALEQLSVDNAGADAGGTGNKTLDAAINYFRYWGEDNHPGGAAEPGAGIQERGAELPLEPSAPGHFAAARCLGAGQPVG